MESRNPSFLDSSSVDVNRDYRSGSSEDLHLSPPLHKMTLPGASIPRVSIVFIFYGRVIILFFFFF